MARLIKFKSQCYYCKRWFEKGQAFLQRMDGKWFCHCRECYDSKNTKPQPTEDENG